MSEESYICDSKKFIYSNGYAMLPIEVDNLPESIDIESVNLKKRSSFHVSLFCIKDLLKINPDIEQKALDFFCSFVKEKDISFIKYTGDFRLAKSDKRESVVALCEISNLEEFSEALGQELGINIEPQPTHVTLYTLQQDGGIGLNSPNDMWQKSISIQVSDEVRNGMGLI